IFKIRAAAALLAHGYFFAGLDSVRWNIGLAAIHRNVPMGHKLPCLLAGGREAKPVHHIIEPALQQDKQIRAGLTRIALGFLEDALELSLQHAIHITCLLLLHQLQAVIRHLPSSGRRPVLPRRKGALVQDALALLRDADAQPATNLSYRSTI